VIALHLLRAKLRSLWNLRRSAQMGPWRLLVLVLLGALAWVGILAASHWFLGRVVAIEPIGVVMLRKLLELVLLFLLSILGVSNLIAAFSTFLLADDLPALVAHPVPANALYGARVLENGLYASWMTVTFAAPFFVAVGLVMHAPASYHLTWAVALPLLAVIPTTLATIAAMLLGRVLSARRTRQLLVLLAVVVFTVLFMLFRQLEPERFVDPDERAPLLEVLGQLQTSPTPWLPSAWAAEALWSRLSPVGEQVGHPLLRLFTGAMALSFVAGWVFRATFATAFSRAQEGEGGTVDAEGRRTARAHRELPALARALARRGGHDSPARALARKDRRVFLRDTTQWTQMLLLVALVAIYVVNFSYIRSAGDSGIIPRQGLHFINVSLGGFVAVAVCVRFAFPAISLEGRAFWIVLRAPLPMLEVLRGKHRSLAVPLASLTALLVAITSAWLGSGLLLTTVAVLTVVPLTVGLSGLALGLGARFPRFHVDNAAKIATGLGGVLYMLGGLLLLLVVVLLAVAPTMQLLQWVEHGYLPEDARRWLGPLAAAAVIALPLGVGRLAVRVGARHLETHGIDA
jgi:ABC-2 type transport system permease protein